MRIFNATVFNQTMYGVTEYFTPAQYDALLGSCESFLIQITATQVAGTSPVLTVKSYNSNDEQNWVLRSTVGTASLGTAQLVLSGIPDAGTVMIAAFQRLSFTLAASDNVANVQVIVCGRAQEVL